MHFANVMENVIDNDNFDGLTNATNEKQLTNNDKHTKLPKKYNKTRLYIANAVWYRHPSGQPMNTVIPNLN